MKGHHRWVQQLYSRVLRNVSSLLNIGETKQKATAHIYWSCSYIHSSNTDTIFLVIKLKNMPTSPRFSQLYCCRFRSSWMWHSITFDKTLIWYRVMRRAVPNILKDCSTFKMLGTAYTVMQHLIQEYLDFHTTLSHNGFRISILDHSTRQFVVNDVGQENMYWVLHTNKCTNCVSYISLKLYALKDFHCSCMFQQHIAYHHQGALIFPG
jgi:hypothetical protein